MRRSLASIAAVIAVTGCSASGPVAATSPSQTAHSSVSSASPAAGSSPSASPSAGAGLPLAAVDFSCRLPVVIASPYANGTRLEGGFLTFPAASFEPDPNGIVLGQPAGGFVTSATPVLRATPGGAT